MAHNPAMTGKGRPRIGTPVQVRLPDDLLQYIEADADCDGITRAEQIRRILANHYTYKDDPS